MSRPFKLYEDEPGRTYTIPEDLEGAVGLAIGAGSACWDDLEHAGVFDSTRATAIVDQLVDWINDHYEERITGNA